MRLVKCIHSDHTRVGAIHGDAVRLFRPSEAGSFATLAELLYAADPLGTAERLSGLATEVVPLSSVKLLAPIDNQEVWAAGVTYKRSQVARMEESEAGASHYDKVYTAPRPELFF